MAAVTRTAAHKTKIMGKHLPHSSLAAECGVKKAQSVGQIMALLDEALPLPVTSGGAPISVVLKPGIYLLIATVCVHGALAGDTIQGLWWNQTTTLALNYPNHDLFVNTIVRDNERRCFQFMTITEISSPTEIQFFIGCDELRGTVYGGEFSIKQTGISWAKL